jgi:hypothetical protein
MDRKKCWTCPKILRSIRKKRLLGSNGLSKKLIYRLPKLQNNCMKNIRSYRKHLNRSEA